MNHKNCSYPWVVVGEGDESASFSYNHQAAISFLHTKLRLQYHQTLRTNQAVHGLTAKKSSLSPTAICSSKIQILI
jgi:hypothetical protein